MRALVIDDGTRDKIKAVIAYAEAHKHTIARMKRLQAGDAIPAGTNDNHAIELEHGYRVVFSIEEHPLGWCKHLSVSVDAPGKYPSEQAVELIMDEFGMGNDIRSSLSVWMEEEAQAVNVLTKME